MATGPFSCRHIRTEQVLATLVATLLVVSSVAAGTAGALDSPTSPAGTASLSEPATVGDSAAIDDPPSSGDWPTAGHDANRSGATDVVGPKTAVDARWIHEYDDHDQNPAVVADGRVFVPGDSSLRALDNETGTELWNVTGVRADRVSVSDDLVVATSPYWDELYVFHAANGTELWNNTDFDVQSSVVADGTLYAEQATYGSGVRLHAFDLRTGSEDWWRSYAGASTGGLAAHGDTVYATARVDDGFAREHSVYALNASDGSERWRFEVEGVVSMTPTLVNGTVYVGGGTETHDPKLYALDATDGHVEWIHDLNDRPTAAAASGGSVYVSSGHTVRALDATTGEQRWLHRLSGSLDYGLSHGRMVALAPAVADGVVYAGTRRGDVLAVDGTTGDLAWRYHAGTEVPFRPVVADGRLLVASLNDSSYTHTLYALDGGETATERVLFDYYDLGAYPTDAAVGQQVTVNATVENLADSACSYEAEFTVDGVVKQTTSAEVGTGFYDTETVEFTWTPDAVGTYDVSIEGLPPVEVTVTEASADPVLSQTTLDFGDVDTGDHLDRLVQVKNEGTETLYLDGAQLSGTHPGDYSILSVSQTNVNPGDSATIWLRFAPTASGTRTATLEVDTLFSGALTGTLTGTGVAPAPNASVTPTSYDFGDVPVGQTATTNVTLTNDGAGPLSYDGVTNSGHSAFEVTAGNESRVLAVGDSHEFTVSFAPETESSLGTNLNVLTDDPEAPSVGVSVSGTGVPTPSVTVTPSSLDFGNVSVGSAATANVTIGNDGDAPLAVHGASFETSFLTFSVVSGGGSTVVAPGETHNVTVRFAPLRQGPAATSLPISTNDTYVSVSIRGNGAEQNRAPVTATDYYVVYEGEWLNVSAPGVLANDLDPDDDTIDAPSYVQPGNGTLASFRASGGFNYTADPGFTGTDSFTYRAEDEAAGSSTLGRVVIEVLPDSNRGPDATDDHYSVHAGEWLNVSAPGVLVNDRDPDGDDLDTKYHSDPENGDLHRFSVTGGFEYRADSWQTGTETFGYWMEDEDGETAYATVTIEVLPPQNREPTAVADTYTVAPGEWLNVSAPGVLANDWDQDGDDVDTKYHGNPSHGTLNRFSVNGGFEYLSDEGFTGTDSFVYWVEDEDGETSYTTVTVVVQENWQPTPLDDHYAVLEGEWLNVSAPGVLANDYDLDGDGVDTKYHGDPDDGTLHRFYGPGGFEYLSDEGFTGTDSFTYWVEDERGAEAGIGTVTVEVVDPNATNPVAVDDHYTVYEGEWLNVSAPGVLANDVDPRNHSITTKYHGNPGHGDLQTFSVTGGFEYRPDEGFTGADTFTYVIDDANGNESLTAATVTVEVLPDPDTTGNRAPTAVADTYTVTEGEWLNVSAPGVLANDYDPDGDDVDTKYHGNPDDGTLHRFSVNGGFEYTPDLGFTGTDSFTYWVEDEHGEQTAGGVVTIEVVPDPDATGNRAPTAVADTYTVTEGEWLNVSAPGVLVNDRDPDGDGVDTKYHGNPSHGTLNRFSVTGGFEYRPDPGFTGTDSFAYWVEDEHGATAAGGVVTVTVLPDPNRAPEPVPDDYVVLQGETLDVSAPGVLANDYDLDGDGVVTKYHGNPSHGDLNRFSVTGGFEYTPDPDFVGVDSFTYWVEDEHGEQAAGGTVTITVVDASTTGTADVAIARDEVDFGTVPAGTTARETLTVANVGDLNLTVSGATLSGPNATDFAVVGGNATDVLGYGGTNAFVVEYAPTGLGASEATLTVHSDSPGEEAVNVTLAGTSYDGADPTIHAVNVTGSYADDSNPNGSVVYENETVAFEVDATDAHGTVQDVRVTLNARTAGDTASAFASENGTTGNWTTTVDVSALAEDEYDVTVLASDSRGNWRTVTVNDSVVVDRTPPPLAASVTRLDASNANVTVRSSEPLLNGTLSVDVERPDGNVVTVTMTDEGDHWNGTFATPADGQYGLSVTALDLAGNRGSDTATTRLTTANTTNNTITVQMEPSGLFVRFNTNRSVNDTFVTMTESKVPVAPLVRGQAGLQFLDAALDKRLTGNLSYAVIGIPVDPSLLPQGADGDDVRFRYFNETRGQWTRVPTTIENVTLNGTTGRYWVATVTHFSTYGAVVTDTTPPTITSSTPVDGHEFAAGTTATTLRVDFADAPAGVDADRTAVLFDGTDVTTDGATTITSSSVEYAATGLADGSSHQLEVTVVDELGNSVTEVVSFTVAAPANSGGSPSSGGPAGGSDGDSPSTGSGGSGPAAPAPAVTVTSLGDAGFDATVTDARADQPATIGFPAGELGAAGVSLDSLAVTPTTDGDVALSVSASDSPPAGGATFAVAGQRSVAYIDVAHPSVPDDRITGATFRFTVARDSLADRGVQPDDVTLYRHHDGAWGAIDTRVVDETADSVVYEATAPGLSVFVVATRAAPTTQGTTTVGPTTTAGTTTTAQSPGTTTAATTEPSADVGAGQDAVALAVLALLALAAAAVYLGCRD
ncbi:Ig-like domain-containing protein [Halobacterium wangiae]|uniref:Ig-like domain-containing protein n=1 Tax=Halobacterium wangiae TaxID=2902623 RepID=UPI001E4E8778|nr:Ig-like domain-containing protein [Halobacterium wangiae]